MDVVGGLLLLIALFGLLLGLIKPGLVIWWGNRTRAKVLVTYGLVLLVGVGFAVVGAPSDLEAGRTSLADKDYKEAVSHLEAVKPADPGYAQAQRMLVDARKRLLMSTLDAAEAASLAGDHEKVISLLTDYPSGAAGSVDAAKILEESRQALADAGHERAAKEEQQAAKAKAEEAQREAAQSQERAMADFPECGSDEAEEEVARTMENAPLGRVYGLSILKIKDTRQVAGSATSRDCEGIAQLNNAESHPMTYRFYRDGEDVMVEAEIQGLGE